MFCQILALTAIVVSCKALPKFETEDKGFVPSKGDYFEINGDQLAMESRPANQTTDATAERPARYGFPTYSTDVQVSLAFWYFTCKKKRRKCKSKLFMF